MDASQTAASWLSFVVTAVGLGSLITQANGIRDRLDPFHHHRTMEILGPWFYRQQQSLGFSKPPLVGPILYGNMSAGFCGMQVLHVTRLPTMGSGKAGWATLLSVIHCNSIPTNHAVDDDAAEKGEGKLIRRTTSLTSNRTLTLNKWEWEHLKAQKLVRLQSTACTVISRSTLLTMMVLLNARQDFQHSDGSGFRCAYGTYSGQWYIHWPIAQEAVVTFAPYDFKDVAPDVYPLSFMQRVQPCIHAVCGIVSAPSSGLRIAFCGRKPAGKYMLRFVPKGYLGSHGSRHLYMMMGGKIYEYDYMSAPSLESLPRDKELSDSITIELPSKDGQGIVEMKVPLFEQHIINHALDCLPWSFISWSIHRGMRDYLVAYAKPLFDKHRQDLATLLQETVAQRPDLLDLLGWNPSFVRNRMADMAASAIMDGRGNSGDIVRLVTDVVTVTVGTRDISRLDDVYFWRRDRDDEKELDTDAIIALTKVFVLEWSNEFDYQLDHKLPLSLYFG